MPPHTLKIIIISIIILTNIYSYSLIDEKINSLIWHSNHKYKISLLLSSEKYDKAWVILELRDKKNNIINFIRADKILLKTKPEWYNISFISPQYNGNYTLNIYLLSFKDMRIIDFLFGNPILSYNISIISPFNYSIPDLRIKTACVFGKLREYGENDFKYDCWEGIKGPNINNTLKLSIQFNKLLSKDINLSIECYPYVKYLNQKAFSKKITLNKTQTNKTDITINIKNMSAGLYDCYLSLIDEFENKFNIYRIRFNKIGKSAELINAYDQNNYIALLFVYNLWKFKNYNLTLKIFNKKDQLIYEIDNLSYFRTDINLNYSQLMFFNKEYDNIYINIYDGNKLLRSYELIIGNKYHKCFDPKAIRFILKNNKKMYALLTQQNKYIIKKGEYNLSIIPNYCKQYISNISIGNKTINFHFSIS